MSAKTVIGNHSGEVNSLKNQLAAKNDQVEKLEADLRKQVESHDALLQKFQQTIQPAPIVVASTAESLEIPQESPKRSPRHAHEDHLEAGEECEALDAIIDSLEDNKVKSLKLTGIPPLQTIIFEQIEDFAGMIGTNTSVEVASFDNAGLNARVANAILQGLSKNKTVTEIDFSNNTGFDDNSAAALVTLVTINKNIEKLTVKNTGLSPQTIEKLQQLATEHSFNLLV
jgi:hypothetical protein